MHYARTALLAIVAALAASLVLTVAASGVAHADAMPKRGVALVQARYAPDYIQVLPARHQVTPPQRCLTAKGKRDGYWSDIQAYTGTGRAVGAQQWNRFGDLMYWRTRTGRVTFDGITFVNRSKRSVLVAGWCEHWQD